MQAYSIKNVQNVKRTNFMKYNTINEHKYKHIVESMFKMSKEPIFIKYNTINEHKYKHILECMFKMSKEKILGKFSYISLQTLKITFIFFESL